MPLWRSVSRGSISTPAVIDCIHLSPGASSIIPAVIGWRKVIRISASLSCCAKSALSVQRATSHPPQLFSSCSRRPPPGQSLRVSFSSCVPPFVMYAKRMLPYHEDFHRNFTTKNPNRRNFLLTRIRNFYFNAVISRGKIPRPTALTVPVSILTTAPVDAVQATWARVKLPSMHILSPDVPLPA